MWDFGKGRKEDPNARVNNIQYDEFGSRTYFEYGNGVSSAYIYNSATRRLQNLTTTATNGNLHNLTHTYGLVGNSTDEGFTKHYFIAGQKIASKLGEGFSNSDELAALKGEPVAPLYGEYEELGKLQTDRLRRDFDCLGVNYDHFSPGKPRFELLEAAEQTEIGAESNIYFYHSDHLGSSSFLTDGSGFATQHLQYMPFGEDLVHQQNTAAYYTPYTFSGKERDFETGLSYFGARYYDAGLSIWLSVDPLADKYPSLSPYAYVANNPIMYIDPDGREIVLPKGTSTKDTYTILGNLQKLTNDKLVYSTQKDGSIRIKIASLGEGNKPAGTRLIRTLNSSDKVTTIEIGTGGNSARPDSRTSTGKTDWTKSMNGTGDNVTVNFDPSSNPSIKTIDPKTGNVSGRSRPNQVGLAHELIHADHITSGDVDFTSTNHTYQTAGGNVTQTKPNEELRTVGLQGVKSGDITENQIRKEQKQNPRGAY